MQVMTFVFPLLFELLEQVEKVFGANHPDPMEIEKAKKVLKVCIFLHPKLRLNFSMCIYLSNLFRICVNAGARTIPRRRDRKA